MKSQNKKINSKLFIVIPAYNEGTSITNVISNLQESGYENQNIIVVDDGSYDNTYSVAKKTGVNVLKHPINLGQGAALKTGTDYAILCGAEIIVHFDADGQHPVDEIPDLVSPILSGKYDAVLGSRFLKRKSNVGFIKKIVLKIGTLVLRVMYGAKLTDAHNGFRALSLFAAKKIEITQDGMAHASEIIEEIVKHKIKYKEVPVTITYTDYSLSKGQKISNAFNIFFKMVLKKLIK